MKKFLAMTLAAVMALSMAACNEKDDDEDEDKDNSSVSDSADKDSSKDDSSEDDSSDGDSSEGDSSVEDSSVPDSTVDDSSEDDSSVTDDNGGSDERVDVEPSEFSVGELSNGVITAGNLTLTVGDTWSSDEMDGNIYFTPSDYWETGNNLNIMVTASDPYISLYTEDMIAEIYAGTYSDFTMNNFEHTTISGYEAIDMSYSFSGMTFTQIMINAADESYVLTFTGNTGDFADVSSIVDTIEVK